MSALVRARRAGLRLGYGRRRAGDARRVDVARRRAVRRRLVAVVRGGHHAHVPLAGDGHDPLRPVRDPGRAEQAHEEAAQLHRRADQEVAGVGEALGVPGGEDDEERTELADGDGDEAADDERPVPVAGGQQLRPDAAVLGEDLGGGGVGAVVLVAVRQPVRAELLRLVLGAPQGRSSSRSWGPRAWPRSRLEAAPPWARP